jgi:4-diphosphocytidyl-2-C-methyl-D-erythritol kinase
MTNFLEIQAPAKINLFLHVVGQRQDGYHLLQSVFSLIDLTDQVLLRTRDDGQIFRLNSLDGIPPESDLVIRAARLLQKKTGVSLGADIDLIKRIPMGAGLGGGSSDAASTLIGLNFLWKTGLDRSTLAKIGLELGADVPFFIHGKNAFVEGIGEDITPVKLPEANYLLVFPGVGIPTQTIFQDPSLTRNHSSITMMDFVAHLSENGFGNNDLQDVVVQKHPEVKKALGWLLEQFPGSNPRMSGSGSTVFVMLPENLNAELKAQNVLLKLPKNWTGFVVRGLQEHPSYNLVACP